MEDNKATAPEANEEDEKVVAQRIKDKLRKQHEETEEIRKKEKDKTLETQKKRKREQRKEEESKLAPFQKKDEDFNPVLKHNRKKKARTEQDEEYHEWLKTLEEERSKLCEHLKSILPPNKTEMMDQLKNFTTSELVTRFKRNIIPMWRLNMIGVPVRMMMSVTRMTEKDFVGGKKALDEFKMRLGDLCRIVDKHELAQTPDFEEEEEDLGEL